MTPPAELTDILPLDWTPCDCPGWQWTATDGPLTYFVSETRPRTGWMLGVDADGSFFPGYVAPGLTTTEALEKLIHLAVGFRGRAGKLDRLAVMRLAMGVQS